jgi:hypothetical protein
MTEVKRPSKPSKKLSDITFEHDDAHIALVSKQQGGGAVGHNYAIVLKANKFDPVEVKKASKVQVELEITEFLTRFFYMCQVDAEILARTLGFTTKMQEKMILEQKEKMLENEEVKIDPEYPSYDSDAEEIDMYVTSKVQSLNIMKALHNEATRVETMANLTKDEYLQLLKDQAMLEKAMKKVEALKAKESNSPASAAGSEDTTSVNVDKSKVSQPAKSDKLDKLENKVMVEELQKALDNQKVELEKALAQIAEFEKAKKEALVKAKTDKIAEAVQDEQLAAILVKAGLTLDSDEDFNTYVGAVRTLSEKIEKSALFREEGVSAHQEQKEVKKTSGVAAILEKKYNK